MSIFWDIARFKAAVFYCLKCQCFLIGAMCVFYFQTKVHLSTQATVAAAAAVLPRVLAFPFLALQCHLPILTVQFLNLQPQVMLPILVLHQWIILILG